MVPKMSFCVVSLAILALSAAPPPRPDFPKTASTVTLLLESAAVEAAEGSMPSRARKGAESGVILDKNQILHSVLLKCM